MKTQMLFLIVVLSVFIQAFSFDVSGSLGTFGSLNVANLSSSKTQDVNYKYYKPLSGSGKVSSNVNLFTGQPVYSIPITSVDVRGEFAYPITIAYGGPISPAFREDNEKRPTGWLGLGFDMNLPYVATNHRGTGNYNDDNMVCNLGPFGGGQLLKHGDSYFIQSNPSVKVIPTKDERKTYYDPTYGKERYNDYYNQIIGWTFELPNGTVLKFGRVLTDPFNTESSYERIVQYRGKLETTSTALVQTGPESRYSDTKPYIFRWELREISRHGNSLKFEHQKFNESLWNGKHYTRESYLKNIIWNDAYGNEIQKIGFELGSKDNAEFYASTNTTHQSKVSQSRKLSQVPYETKYLKSVKTFSEGVSSSHFKFNYSLEMNKRRLDKIQLYNEADEELPSWEFEYQKDLAYKDYAVHLSKIIKPSGASDEYTYEKFDLNKYAYTRQNLTPDQLSRLKINKDHYMRTDKLNVQAECSQQFCYRVVSYNKDISKNGGKTHVQVFLNTGNYFKSTPILDTIIDDVQYPQNIFVGLRGNDFVVADRSDKYGSTGQSRLYCWYFNGDKFEFVEDDYFEDNIDVYFSNDYLIVNQPDDDRNWVYSVDGAGNWQNITCQVTNNTDYGESVGARSYCTNTIGNDWDSDLLIQTGKDFYVILHKKNDVFYVFSKKGDGEHFAEVKNVFSPNSSVYDLHGTGNTNNWNDHIESIQVLGDYLIVGVEGESKRGEDHSKVYYRLFRFDGEKFHYMRNLTIGIDNDNKFDGPKNFGNIYRWSGQYLVEVEQEGKRIRLWEPEVKGGILTFNLKNTQSFSHIISKDIEELGDNPLGIDVSISGDYVVINFLNKDGNIYKDDHISGEYARSLIYHVDENGIMDELVLQDDDYGPDCTGTDGHVSINSREGVGTFLCVYTSENTSAGWYTFRIGSPKRLTITKHLVGINRSRISYPSKLLQVTYDHKPSDEEVKYVYSNRRFITGNDYDNELEFPTYIVSGFAMNDGVGSRQTTHFEYDYDPACYIEYNVFSELPQFECARLYQNDGELGDHQYVSYIDTKNTPLLYNESSKIGRVGIQASNRRDGTFINTVGNYYGFLTSSEWPNGVSFLHADTLVTKQHGSGGKGGMLSESLQFQRQKNTSIPRFSSTEFLGNRRQINQSILDSENRVTQSLSFIERGSSFVNLETADKDRGLHLTSNANLTTTNHIFRSYSPTFPHKVDVVYQGVASNEQSSTSLKSGSEPSYTIIPRLVSKVLNRNSYGQILESVSYNGLESNGTDRKTHSSIIYEGIASMPFAIFSDAKLNDVTAFGFENGSVSGLKYFDLPSTSRGGSYAQSYNLYQPNGGKYVMNNRHSGRYSYKFENGGSVTAQIHYDDLEGKKSDYILSAWFKTESNSGYIRVNLHGENTTYHSTIQVNSPADEPYKPNVWQRYELKIPYETLLESGVIGEDGYIRFFIGSKNNDQNTYVDDIVCYPAHATFSLRTYNHRGQVLDETNQYHLVHRYEYDRLGRVIATRDSRGNTFGQSGSHRIGEN